MQGGDTALLATDDDVLGGEHGSVGGALIAISLDLHTTGDLADGLAAGGVGDVNEGIVTGGVDVGNTVDEGLSLNVGTVTDLLVVVLGHPT